ncbi:sensor histidine kinase [Paracoccus sp. YIM 132242]|uniref:histidine kinase n=1 Tax=Paracoccus lichenicola TaxID=2665644 RepID=A0A6L6HPG2_9RHOB|nr:sensor histidine kinase [Paracoccus lichenicola]
MRARRGSIRLRLLVTGAFSVALALLLAAGGLALLFDRHVERVAAGELSDRLEHLASAAEIGADGALVMPAPPRDPLYRRPFSGHYWQIEAPGARLRSRSLWDHVLVLPPATGETWQGELTGPLDQPLLALVRRITVATPGGDLPLRIAVTMDRADLDRARAGFLRDLAPYLALLGLALVTTLAVAVSVALRPLSAIEHRVAALGRDRERRIGAEVPAEVLPLARQIDALLENRQAEVERARLRAGDLAHGLKTPLQALMGEAARLRDQGSPDAAAGIEEIARTMHAHVDRELARARLASDAARACCDALDVARSVAAVLRRTPRGEALRIEVEGAAGIRVRLDRADLAEALGALAENAVRHARSGVAVACVRAGDQAVIRVRDDGPGAAPGLLDLLPGRGLRLDERDGGTGLGLAIAADIAGAVGGTLRLRNLDPGFEAELTLPALA